MSREAHQDQKEGRREGKHGSGKGSDSKKRPERKSQGLYIELRDNEKIDGPLKNFKRMVLRSGLMKDLRKKEAFTKPSDAKKEKRKASASRRRREETRALQPDPFM